MGEKKRIRIDLTPERQIHIKIQQVERKITAKGNPSYRSGHSKSIRIYGDTTVEEVFGVIKEALEKWSKEKA